MMLVVVITAMKVLAYAATGMWAVGMAMESNSMEPNMHPGDLILIQSTDHTDIVTYEDGKTLYYKSFNDYGDIIAYCPEGRIRKSPILHRAVFRVEKGEEMWDGGPQALYTGYITKGDNNPGLDQQGSISYHKPVKPEWVTGLAKARILYLGYLLSGLKGAVLVNAVIYLIILGLFQNSKEKRRKGHEKA